MRFAEYLAAWFSRIIDLAQHLGFFQPDDLDDVTAARDECARTVYGLLRKLSTAAVSR